MLVCTYILVARKDHTAEDGPVGEMGTEVVVDPQLANGIGFVIVRAVVVRAVVDQLPRRGVHQVERGLPVATVCEYLFRVSIFFFPVYFIFSFVDICVWFWGL